MKVGVLGTGDISKAYMKASAIAGIITEAVFNRDLSKAESFAHRYAIPKAYDNYEAFLADQGFDTVYVGLPNGLHYEYALNALKCGKNVIIEKPFCSNLREFNELVNTANEHKRFIIEMDRVQALPNFKSIRDHIGNIGVISAVSANYSQYSRKYDAYLNGVVGNVFTTECSGGALMDLGVYAVHDIVALFGMPKKVSYKVNKLETGVDISGHLLMEYEGFNATVIVSKNSIGNKHFMIQGVEGSIYSASAPGVINSLELITREGTEDISYQQPYDGFAYTLMEIKDIIDNRNFEKYRNRLTQSKKVMTVLDAARKSAGIVFSADC